MSGLQKLISVFFFLFSIFMNNAWGISKIPLVDVFCEELIYQNRLGKRLGAENQTWSQFAERLQKRQRRTIDDTLSHLELQSCVESYRGEFDEAEFILGGKERIDEDGARQMGRKNSDLCLTQFTVDSITDDLSPRLKVLSIAESTAHSSLRDSSIRLARYQELWQQFLKSLRIKINATASAVH
ncbi:MAG: hypothetical protein HY537_13635 [Deltaproteobacteria bacterium]|nr:hypothetical protein [Deltaproteobacteria bacterium]